MANEITVRCSLQVRKNNVYYYSQPTQYLANQTGEGGPVPGMVLATLSGVNLDFTPLNWPSMCRLQNYDTVNFITYGIFDTILNRFFPLGELLPGEVQIVRLSRYLSSQYPGIGTSTNPGVGSSTYGGLRERFQIRADTSPCKVLVEAFQY